MTSWLILEPPSWRCHKVPTLVLKPLILVFFLMMQFSVIFQTRCFCLIWFMLHSVGAMVMLKASGSSVLLIRILSNSDPHLAYFSWESCQLSKAKFFILYFWQWTKKDGRMCFWKNIFGTTQPPPIPTGGRQYSQWLNQLVVSRNSYHFSTVSLLHLDSTFISYDWEEGPNKKFGPKKDLDLDL